MGASWHTMWEGHELFFRVSEGSEEKLRCLLARSVFCWRAGPTGTVSIPSFLLTSRRDSLIYSLRETPTQALFIYPFTEWLLPELILWAMEQVWTEERSSALQTYSSLIDQKSVYSRYTSKFGVTGTLKVITQGDMMQRGVWCEVREGCWGGDNEAITPGRRREPVMWRSPGRVFQAKGLRVWVWGGKGDEVVLERKV